MVAVSFIEFIPILRETIHNIRARLDTDANAGVDPGSLDFVDTTEGGFYYDLTQSPALEIARLYDFAASEVVGAALPQTAWGQYLDKHAQVLNLFRKPAVKATGQVTFVADPPADPPTAYADVVTADAPGGYWRLEDGSITTDSSGNNNTLSVVGAPADAASLIYAGSGRDFAGSADAYTAADHSTLDLGDTFSLEVWLKPDTVSGQHTLISKGTNGYQLRTNATAIELLKEGTGVILSTTGISLEAGGIYHVVAIKAGAGGAWIFVNGANVSGTVTDRTCANTTTALNIGRKSDATEYFDGILDEVAVYPVQLTTDQITEHYEAGGPATSGLLVPAGTLISTVQTDTEVEPVAVQTTEGRTLAASPAPTGLWASPQSTGGILTPANYYYKVTARVFAGETQASAEAKGTIPAQVLSAPTGLDGTAYSSGGTLVTDVYYYKVTATNANGETTGSTEINRSVTGPSGRVDLTWNAVTGAAGYRIYRGLSAGDEDVYYTSATNSYSDTGASATSGAVPTQNTAQVGQNSLTWNTVAGATSYSVYRSTVSGTETLLVKGLPTASYTDTGAISLSSAKPPTNDLNVEAMESGPQGNVAAGTLSQLVSGIPGVASVSNAYALTGGADVESDQRLRERVLLEYASPPGAGNVSDYERWALAYPPVGYVTVEPLWNGAGTVRVIITDQNNDPVSAAVISGLQEVLDPVAQMGMGKAPVGALVTVATPSSVTITVAATLTCSPGYTITGANGTNPVESRVGSAVTDYIDTLRPGSDVIREKVISRIIGVPGVLDVTACTLNGSAANVSISALQVATTGTITLT